MNVTKINPCSFLENPLKPNFLENLDGIFLEQATLKRKGNEEHKNDSCSLSISRNGKILILNENEALNPRDEN